MKLGTIWKEAHSHFHGTCGVYPMQSVNINLVTHAFSCDIKEVLVRGYAEVDYSCITGLKQKQCCVGYGFISAGHFCPTVVLFFFCHCPPKILLLWLSEFFEIFARKSCHLCLKIFWTNLLFKMYNILPKK